MCVFVCVCVCVCVSVHMARGSRVRASRLSQTSLYACPPTDAHLCGCGESNIAPKDADGRKSAGSHRGSVSGALLYIGNSV